MSHTNESVWIRASSSDDLLTKLRAVNTTVPPRHCGRTKEHTEQAAICNFLAAFAEENMFDYPLDVVRREQPDFILSSSLGRIGIEITEAVRRSDAHVDSKGTGAVRMINKEPSLNESLTSEEAKEIAEGKQPDAPGWEGNEVEDRWADDMFSIIVKKKEKFTNYERCNKNWLYIYDNLDFSLLALDRLLAAENLSSKLHSSEGVPFDRIFIEFGPQDGIAQFHGKGFNLHPINRN